MKGHCFPRRWGLARRSWRPGRRAGRSTWLAAVMGLLLLMGLLPASPARGQPSAAAGEELPVFPSADSARSPGTAWGDGDGDLDLAFGNEDSGPPGGTNPQPKANTLYLN